MLTNTTNLVLLGLIALVLVRSIANEMRRRRRLEWRLQILELLATSVRRGHALLPVVERAAIGESGHLATICRDLAASLSEGLPLSRALAKAAPDCFPRTRCRISSR